MDHHGTGSSWIIIMVGPQPTKLHFGTRAIHSSQVLHCGLDESEWPILSALLCGLVIIKVSLVEKLRSWGVLTPAHLTESLSSHITHITHCTLFTSLITHTTYYLHHSHLMLHSTHITYHSHHSHHTSFTSHITHCTSRMTHITHCTLHII